MKISEPTHQYDQMLQQAEWLTRREQILKRDNYRCRNCQATSNLQVHHRQYIYDRRSGSFRKPWDYDSINLITLCGVCHKRGHELYEIPKFNI